MRSQPNSPSDATSPSSHGMVRKRTLQDAQPQTPGMALAQSSPDSRSPVAAQGFRFDSSPRTGGGGLLSTPATIYSSPMARSASAQASFSPFSPYDGAETSPLGKADPDYARDSKPRPPRIKRRRTLADAGVPDPAAATEEEFVSPRTRQGYGKDGEDVWPEDCEQAFQTALRLLPRLGRKKLEIKGRSKGRNELISDYILRVTGKERTRKQVSSHIQVLKDKLKHNAEFMDLVNEPAEGDDRFEGNNAALFFGEDSPYARLGTERAPAFKPRIDISATTNLAPMPQFGQPTYALHSPFVMHPAHGVATPTTQLANAFETMSVLPAPVPPSCPFLPADLSMWSPPDDTGCRERPHVFAQLRTGAEPASKKFVEDLPSGVKRYPMLHGMIERQPCQFLHVKLNLAVPTASESTGLADVLSTQLRLHSLQELNLHVLTSFYHDGELGAQLIDALGYPRRLDASHPSPSHTSGSPLARSFEHSFAYDVPFSPHWWMTYLASDEALQQQQQKRASPTRRAGRASRFARTGASRFEMQESLKGISILQEFVVNYDEHAPLPHPMRGSALRGSDLGAVVLVVAYDVELCEGVRKGTAEMSYLSTRRLASPRRPPVGAHAGYTAYAPPAPGPAPPMSRSMTSPARMAYPAMAQEPDHGAMLPPPPPLPRLPSSSRAAPQPRHHQAPNHPSLSLRIPSPTQFVRREALAVPGATVTPLGSATTPHTPWGQIAHTPDAPPPLLAHGYGHDAGANDDSAQQRERLQHMWLQTSTAYDLHSPALMGLSHAPPPPQSSHPPFDGEAFAGASAFPLESAAAVAGLAPPYEAAHVDVGLDPCFAPSAAYDESAFLPSSAHALNALNALTASAAALSTPSFDSSQLAAGDLFSMPSSPFELPVPPPLPHALAQPQPQGSPNGSLSTPKLEPEAMSVSSSSSGSSASLQSVDEASSRARAPAVPVGGDPVKPSDKASARKAEQAYFSSLFGSSTKYSV